MVAHSRFSDYEEQGPYFETETITEFHYDASGRRLLKRAPRVSRSCTATQRTRYFFNGLTEEIAKVSVPGGHADTAFAFVEEEDGLSASEWYHSITAAGISVSSVADAARRSDVIKCQNNTTNNTVFRIGEKEGTSENPNDSAWDSPKRVISYWMKGGASAMNVQVSASTGEKYVQYLFGTETSGALSGGNARVYLGYAASADWSRFERNVQADFDAYAGGGATWIDTDGLYIAKPLSTPLSYAFYVDDVRLSDSVTVEHNTLGPGVIGHILRNTTWDATSSLAREDKWFHYDQVGSVLSVSDEIGDLTVTHQQDAFGNVMASWIGGEWGLPQAQGRHLNSKENDEHTNAIYMFQRWYSSEIGVFLSTAPYPPMKEHRYTFAIQNPVVFSDPTGEESWSSTFRLFGEWALPKLERQLCPAEVKHYSTYSVLDLISARKARKLAWRASAGLNGEANGPRDAVRHCTWICELTKAFGQREADKLGLLHEGLRQGDEDVMLMDNQNNCIGSMIGDAGGEGIDCGTSCISALFDGRLKVMPQNTWSVP